MSIPTKEEIRIAELEDRWECRLDGDTSVAALSVNSTTWRQMKLPANVVQGKGGVE